mmetsp:Transcript_13032/g.31890  ORF Transcript_13032/g.31890 Transcript_13032/m.31890 type:complete len:283 (+) Transcript_13032:1535-2383(+)
MGAVEMLVGALAPGCRCSCCCSRLAMRLGLLSCCSCWCSCCSAIVVWSARAADEARGREVVCAGLLVTPPPDCRASEPMCCSSGLRGGSAERGPATCSSTFLALGTRCRGDPGVGDRWWLGDSRLGDARSRSRSGVHRLEKSVADARGEREAPIDVCPTAVMVRTMPVAWLPAPCWGGLGLGSTSGMELSQAWILLRCWGVRSDGSPPAAAAADSLSPAFLCASAALAAACPAASTLGAPAGGVPGGCAWVPAAATPAAVPAACACLLGEGCRARGCAGGTG